MNEPKSFFFLSFDPYRSLVLQMAVRAVFSDACTLPSSGVVLPILGVSHRISDRPYLPYVRHIHYRGYGAVTIADSLSVIVCFSDVCFFIQF